MIGKLRKMTKNDGNYGKWRKMKENNGKLEKMTGYDGEQRKMTANGGKMTENDKKWRGKWIKIWLFTCVRLPKVWPDEPLGPSEGVVEVLLRGVVLVDRPTVVLAQEPEETGPLVLPHGGLACGAGNAWGRGYCSLKHLFLWEFCPVE